MGAVHFAAPEGQDARPYVCAWCRLLRTALPVKGESLGDFLDASNWSWIWFWYLVIFGSIIAYSAYLWLVSNAPVGLTATYAYVNPIIAVTLGAVFLDEVITVNYAVGGSIIVLGVLIVVTSESKMRIRTEVE